MLDRLNLVADNFNVSGCEDKMAEYLIDEIAKIGLETHLIGNNTVCALKKGASPSSKTIMLSTPLDIPGFLALFCDEKNAYLSATKELPFDFKEKINLLDENKNVILAEKESDKKTELKTPRNDIVVGDTFRPNPSLSQSQNKVSGFFSTKYALILCLLEIMNVNCSENLLFVFTDNSFTSATKGKNAARRFKPDLAISLGSMEKNMLLPVVLAKDGNCFSDRALLNRFLGCGKESKDFEIAVSSTFVTQSEKISAFEDIPCLSVVLPYNVKKDGKETFSISAYKKLVRLLTTYLENPNQK